MAKKLDPNTKIEVPPEAILYAKILKYGSMFGILTMLITFIIYITGILPPYVLPQKIPQLWHLTAYEFLQHINLHSGWDWIHYLSYGDMLNYVGIIFLAGLTIVGYIAIIPFLFTSGARAVAIIALIEVAVLLLAASGFLHVEH